MQTDFLCEIVKRYIIHISMAEIIIHIHHTQYRESLNSLSCFIVPPFYHAPPAKALYQLVHKKQVVHHICASPVYKQLFRFDQSIAAIMTLVNNGDFLCFIITINEEAMI